MVDGRCCGVEAGFISTFTCLQYMGHIAALQLKRLFRAPFKDHN